jgi:hypothetical protein
LHTQWKYTGIREVGESPDNPKRSLKLGPKCVKKIVPSDRLVHAALYMNKANRMPNKILRKQGILANVLLRNVRNMQIFAYPK